MFFLFGSPRSGTTLLAQCLNAHPDIVVPDESDFIIPSAFIFDRLTDPAIRQILLKQLIVNTTRFRTSIGDAISPAQVEEIINTHAERMDQLLEALYAAVAIHANAKIAGDKSPNDLLFLRMLIKVGGVSPNAKIIHIVRDVRDVLSSIKNANLTEAPERWFPRFWSTSNLYLNDLYHQSAQYKLVRYEDFVRDPERILEGLCTHLGLEYQSMMLDPDRRHARYRQMPHHRKLYDRISDRNIGLYRTMLPHDISARCETVASEALRTFGY
jgi:hypothetical protein